MLFRSTLRVYVWFLLGSVGLLLLAAGCTRQGASPAGNIVPENAAPSASSAYAGNAACADCHAQEFKDHAVSNHALALHLMEPASLGASSPPPGTLTGTPTTLLLADSKYSVDTAPPRGFALPLQYAFGAGKICFTFVGLLPDSKSFELRASYVPATRQWRATPGQEYLAASAFGIRHNAKDTRRCFGCHVSTLPPSAPAPEKRFLGVGCEACHGPGVAHIAAMRSGQAMTVGADLHINRVAAWGAKQQNEMCGQCHRTGADLNPDHPDLAVTARFQPYGLMLSRCFKESRNTLACTTCHNPHQNTSHDSHAYELACLRCHSASASPVAPVPVASAARSQEPGDLPQSKTTPPPVRGKVCPVNPRAGCIGCHMPARKMLPDSMLGTAAADHYIRVIRPGH